MSLLQREARAAGLLPEPLASKDDKKKAKGEQKKIERRGLRRYEKKYELVKDYLIPVVRLMKVEGKTHTRPSSWSIKTWTSPEAVLALSVREHYAFSGKKNFVRKSLLRLYQTAR